MGEIPGRVPFSQRSERATTIDNQINVQDESVKAKQNKLQITNSKLEKDAGRTERHANSTYTAEVLWSINPITLTHTRRLCVSMSAGSTETIGATTILGCLQYGLKPLDRS